MSFEKETFSMAKALHHINIGKQYFEDAKFNCSFSAKGLINNYIAKCDFILNSIFHGLDPETREVFKQEFSDCLVIDSINDKLMHLDVKDREKIEEIIDMVKRGEILEISKIN